MINDGLDIYNRFDEWTMRTSVLDGSGLTWIVRIPLNLVIVAISLVAWLVARNTNKGASNAKK